MALNDSPGPTTRIDIVREASRLFNERGYHGTSLREIAEAVGIRKQSVSHYFPAKQSILEELLSETLTEPLRVARQMRDCAGSPAARLWAYIRFDVQHLLRSPYVLQGLFGTYLLQDPALVPWFQGASDLYDAVAAIVAEGTAAGEFREINPDFAAGAIGALVEQTFSVWEPYGFAPDVPVAVADFCLHALLRDPADLERVRVEAESLAAAERICPAG